MTLMLLLRIVTFVLTFARGKRIKEKAKILICLNVVSLLVAIRRIFSDGSFPSICCSQRGDFYQVGSREGGGGGEMFGSSCPPPPSRTTPQSLATLQSHAGVAGVRREPERGAHCSTAGPQQLRPAGTTLKDTELGQRTSRLPTGRCRLGGREREKERKKRAKFASACC